MISILVFILVSTLGFGWAFKNYRIIYHTIRLGKQEPIDGSSTERWKNVFLVAFGQKKMFKSMIPAFLHLFIYTAFLITQIELLEIVVDGMFHTHRIFAGALGNLYDVIISFLEILSVFALVATIAFLYRRNVLKVARFHSPEMKAWPFRDGNIILAGEIILLIGIFTMNGAEQTLAKIYGEHTLSHHFAISSTILPGIFKSFDSGTLHVLERTGWWLHFLAVLLFINYLPVSKHLHIFMAFFNTYFARLKPRGEMENIPVIHQEVKSMLGLVNSSADSSIENPTFGVKDIFDLPQRVLISAYSCTECGRCTAVCPANLTGKKLSPRKIMMDIRDRCEEISRSPKLSDLSASAYDDGKNLFSYISEEELYACTACNACVEACPVLINPLEPILEMRRFQILNESKGPASWTAMFNSLENNGAVWAMSENRSAWAEV